MLVHPSRRRSVELLRDSRLLHEILPEAIGVLMGDDALSDQRCPPWDRTLAVLERLGQPSFAVSLAGLLREIWLAKRPDEAWYEAFCRRWRLSNHDAEVAHFCLCQEEVVRTASRIPWPRLQRILIDPRIDSLLTYAESVSVVIDGDAREIEFCRQRLQLPAAELNPSPLITGDDLRVAGVRPGPIYKEILEQLRDAQLLQQLRSRDEALAWVRQRWKV